MRPYYLQSLLFHLSFFIVTLLFTILRPTPDIIWFEGPGFDLHGGGGGQGGDGRAKPGAIKKAQKGQVVPQPVPVPVPEKPAPVKKATRDEDTWNVKSDKKPQKEEKARAPADTSAVLADKDQKATSNIITRGVKNGEKTGEGGFDHGEGGEGGTGLPVGIGFGPGGSGGFGFGGYLSIMRKRIWSEWLQYTTIGNDKSCVVGMTVNKAGMVSNIKLIRSSGDTLYDNVSMRAIRNASPLPPLPANFPKSNQEFRIQFKLLN